MSSGIATVKQVLSGDSVVLVGPPRGGPPPEKQLCFSSIIAPAVGMKSLTRETQDEPYGWSAREYLRKLVIGKQVEFKVEYVHNTKEYGWIKLAEKDRETEGTLSSELLRKGLVKLRPYRTSPCASDYDELEKCQDEAKEAKLGIWSEDSAAAANTIRNVTWAINDVTYVKAFVDRNKNKKMAGIVEYVRDGGCMRILFTEEMVYCSVLISGIQCDGFKREIDENGKDKIIQEPLSAETKFFVEYRLLNRDIEARIEAADDYGNLYASIYHPNGNIAILLLRNGFAKIQDWSARLTESPSQLREAMIEAQTKQLRRWKIWQQEKIDNNEYTARVKEVLSGDCIIVAPPEGGEKRLYLASIKCPKVGNRNKSDEPFAMEAKELTRKTLIGRKVKIVEEYIRDMAANSTSAVSNATSTVGSDLQGKMHFVSVSVDNDKNMAELLVSQGLAKCVSHRADDKRASNYDVLVEVEKAVAEKKIGVHTAPEKLPQKYRINDLTGAENALRARSFESQLSKFTKINGIVDYIFHAGRYKIRIPSENLAIAFLIAAIKCPQSSRPNTPNKTNDPFYEEAMNFARDNLLQREVSIKVFSVDRRGTFIGILTLHKKNFALDLLEHGYAFITSVAEASLSGVKTQMLEAEQKAKAAKLNIWSLPGSLENGVEDSVDKEIDETFTSVCITHINSLTDFYIQCTRNSALANLMKQLSALDVSSLEFRAGSLPKKGDIVLAKFSIDHEWYRARIESYDYAAEVVTLLYIDFGNAETLPITEVRRCPQDMNTEAIIPQAKLCALSGLLLPLDFEEEVAGYFHDYANGKLFHCKVEKIDVNKKRHVILTEEEVSATANAVSINELLVRQGFAQLDKRSNTKIFSRLQKEEQTARKLHLHMWRYGDVDDDEPEEFPSLGSTNKKNNKKK